MHQKRLNEKQTSWIARAPDGLFDIKKPLWHFKKAVPEWFPRNFRKAWYKAHRYLSNIHSNLLFYLQTETYVSRPLQPPPLPLLPHWFTAAGFLPHSLPFSSLSSIFISVYLYHFLSSPIGRSNFLSFQLSRCLLLHSCSFAIVFLNAAVAVCASGTTANSHLKHFRETHICCFRT